ncbi:WecB/TagA/CpsF family glycosyltransferase [Methylobacterium sp. BTF04]|uniref:WecB/TagA/CpsF family glycosyltransferase n=1 Tax=Methylobacterium sp. BTF04 TaxID=2708300 RepID=UPI0013D6CA84|nr:WecB/TagA/CpsF family glycosyltransferase [Methylobacterium sp. BTF04]NEU11688.1 WecB/TagA/CpsF family glycosyltransferase [Methylobacterium sp. BTF04]
MADISSVSEGEDIVLQKPERHGPARGHDPGIAYYRLGGVPVSITDMKGLSAALARRLARGRAVPGAFVVFRDAHGIVRAQDDAVLRDAHEAALLVCADGRPLAWIGRLRGHDAIAQVPGIESVEAMCRAGLAHGWRHYFLGGGPGVAETLAREMQVRVPGLAVAGYETLPFRPLTDAETKAMRAKIGACGAQVLWIGLGTPKQELFMHAHAPHLPGTVAMGVGAAFDVNIGAIPRAPKVLQRAGLEWLYRLIREPRRLSRRYATVVPRFIAIVLREAIRRT